MTVQEAAQIVNERKDGDVFSAALKMQLFIALYEREPVPEEIDHCVWELVVEKAQAEKS